MGDKAASPNWTGLLPCPFCNGAAKVLTSPAYNRDSGEASACAVICARCNAAGPHIEPQTPRPAAELERHAIAKWNRRGNHAGAEWRLQQIARILNSRHVAVVESTPTEDHPNA